eukprot:CAMPEP_0182944738 /NCGR_PEP_ID=MMETSP0105_2-20130417/54432_1 /TAXON_ID=81532 ORGANISM="Acanthoeca-like sp., Strain 10tr" /NCGR_SAMPLE_ID=MMETSP0105_2 /ASSEMBLY_ACC=CAM_ASM_000205 /LENGTH=47 /DNA_ID= /DNA_START= /DNA_END= /DNA_ORIENTATION=
MIMVPGGKVGELQVAHQLKRVPEKKHGLAPLHVEPQQPCHVGFIDMS